MLWNGSDRWGAADEHAGYVAGRYRNGVWSDEWTDVARCAERTFTGYAAACVCGWRGPSQPVTAEGHMARQRTWVFEHLAQQAGVTATATVDV